MIAIKKLKVLGLFPEAVFSMAYRLWQIAGEHEC